MSTSSSTASKRAPLHSTSRISGQWGAFLQRALTDAGVDVSFFQLIPSAQSGVAIDLLPDTVNAVLQHHQGETPIGNLVPHPTPRISRARRHPRPPYRGQGRLPPAGDSPESPPAAGR